MICDICQFWARDYFEWETTHHPNCPRVTMPQVPDLVTEPVPLDPGIQFEFDEVAHLQDALAAARRHGLESEFLVFFLRLVREGKDTPTAACYARGEWDF